MLTKDLSVPQSKHQPPNQLDEFAPGSKWSHVRPWHFSFSKAPGVENQPLGDLVSHRVVA